MDKQMNPESKPKLSSLSVFFPCYNDEGTIGSTVLKSFDILRKVANDYEVIVIDDGSKDNSLRILEELQKHYKELKVIKHDKNMGYGAALRDGFLNATKDFIFYTDGDGQYDVYELADLISRMTDGVDVVNGYKIKRSDPMHRKIIGRLYHNVMKILFNIKIRDVDCDFRLFRRNIFDKVHLESNDGGICVELVKKCQDANLKFVEVPVHHYHRISGSSQFFRVSRIYRSLKSVMKLRLTLMKNRREL